MLTCSIFQFLKLLIVFLRPWQSWTILDNFLRQELFTWQCKNLQFRSPRHCQTWLNHSSSLSQLISLLTICYGFKKHPTCFSIYVIVFLNVKYATSKLIQNYLFKLVMKNLKQLVFSFLVTVSYCYRYKQMNSFWIYVTKATNSTKVKSSFVGLKSFTE